MGADAPQATGGLTDVARRWLAGVERAGWSEVEAAPERTGVVVVDMLMGFARIGPLASPRVDALTAPIAAFLAGLWGRGVRAAWRLEDAHTPDAGEFAVYPPHCLEGSPEAEPLPELMAEPLFAGATRVAKNALTAFDRFDLEAAAHGAGVTRLYVVGDCTDLCVEACAMPLRLYANARRHPLEVAVVADLVDTFDAPGHPGDDSHVLALYRMAQNGVRVVRAPQEGSKGERDAPGAPAVGQGRSVHGSSGRYALGHPWKIAPRRGRGGGTTRP